MLIMMLLQGRFHVLTCGNDGRVKICSVVVQGVMLTHANMFYQIQNLNHYILPDVGDTSLSLLPPWHIYERACGYYLYYSGCCQVGIAGHDLAHQV